MKPVLIFLFLLLLMQTHVSAQNSFIANDPLNHFYFQKSRQQKTLANVSAISGGILAGVGGYLWFMAPLAGLSESGNVEGAKRTGRTMFITGLSLVAVSIPLYSTSNKNKEKANIYLGTSQLTHFPFGSSTTQLEIGISLQFH